MTDIIKLILIEAFIIFSLLFIFFKSKQIKSRVVSIVSGQNIDLNNEANYDIGKHLENAFLCSNCDAHNYILSFENPWALTCKKCKKSKYLITMYPSPIYNSVYVTITNGHSKMEPEHLIAHYGESLMHNLRCHQCGAYEFLMNIDEMPWELSCSKCDIECYTLMTQDDVNNYLGSSKKS